MKKTVSTAATVMNWVVLLLLVAVIVLHLLPYWHYDAFDIATGDFTPSSASIQDYVWRNFDHLDLEDLFYDAIDDYRVNDYILLPILAFLPAVAGVVLCILKRESWLAGVAPVVSGLAGLIAFASSPILAMGNASFMTASLGLIASVIVLVAGAVLLTLRLVEKYVFGKKAVA